ncbi:MAG: YlmH/Sll1252 family protein [Bacillota bacterium]|nr:YlmH/Sll1252 family protein [Bacillota bacterium]
MSKSDCSDDILFSRVQDAIFLSKKCEKDCFVGFLNEHQAEIAKNCAKAEGFKDFLFWGGIDGTERVMFGAGAQLSNSDFPISSVCFLYNDTYELSHRDFLGAFMSSGIKRECIGDIIISKGKCISFVRNEVTEHLKSNVTKVRNVGVTFSESIEDEFSIKPHEFKECSLIVSSMRLDNLVAGLVPISRTGANKLIASGLVFVNHVECTSNSRIIKNQDILTIRGTGKFIICEEVSLTKKGRIKLLINKY